MLAGKPPLPPIHAKKSTPQGGRAHLSKLFARHVRNTISKHRTVAQRGGDPDQLRDIQVGGAARGQQLCACVTRSATGLC